MVRVCTFCALFAVLNQGDCAGVATIDNGIQLYQELARNTSQHLIITDANGSNFPISFK